MNDRIAVEDYYLNPGEIIASERPLILHTTLGSCVCVTAHHKNHVFSCMCHYLLPYEQPKVYQLAKGFYGKSILTRLLELLKEVDSLSNYDFCLYGGGKVIGPELNTMNTGSMNVKVAFEWASINGIRFRHCDVRGNMSRNITFDTRSGAIHVKSYSKNTHGVNT